MLFAPKFCAECTSRELNSFHGDPFREHFFTMQWFAILRVKRSSFDILMGLFPWRGVEVYSPGGWGKNQNFDPDPKNVVITKLFAPKFCAEWSNRELHSSHGDPFREHFFVMQWFAILRVKRASFDILMGLFPWRGVEVYSPGGVIPTRWRSTRIG